MPVDIEGIKALDRPKGLPFRLGKIGHVVLNVTDLNRSVKFYTQLLGLQISDVYGDDMMPGGMVFMRVNPDHHGVALVGSLKGQATAVDLNHMAFEVGSLDEVIRARDFLRKAGVEIHFEGRRRAGCQIAIEFRDPDGHHLEIYWGLDQIGSDGRARPANEWKGARSLKDAIDNPVRGQDTSLATPGLTP